MLKIIYNNIIQIQADHEDSEFPVSNLLTDYKSEIYKSTGSTATLTMQLDSVDPAGTGEAALYLGNTNAYQVEITVKDGSASVLSTEKIYLGQRTEISSSTTYSQSQTLFGMLEVVDGGELTVDAGVSVSMAQNLNQDGQSWYEYTGLTEDHSLEVLLTTDQSQLQVGVARAGSLFAFNSPNWGLSESEVDTSIRKKLASGAEYVKFKSLLRSFSGDLDVKKNEVYAFKYIINKALSGPLAMRLFETTDRGILFGRLDGPTGLGMDRLVMNKIRFTLTESL